VVTAGLVAVVGEALVWDGVEFVCEGAEVA
jgi:hypothetical protein